MIERLLPAKGHLARIIPFDDATVLLPLNEDEARRLLGSFTRTIQQLEATGDFPEKKEYESLKENLQTALFMFHG
jgi:hypothetical protein